VFPQKEPPLPGKLRDLKQDLKVVFLNLCRIRNVLLVEKPNVGLWDLGFCSWRHNFDLLRKRVTWGGNVIQERDRKHSGASQFLRADLNRMDRQVRTIRTDRDDTINARALNNSVQLWPLA
jgi:hypothetical protein